MIAAWLVSVGAIAAHAQPKPPDAAAKRQASAHYKQGKAYFDAGAFDKAIGEFRAAYDIAPADPLLFNIARSYHLANQKPDAAVWYHKYLDAQPDGPLADEARQYLAEVDKAISDEARAAAIDKDRRAKDQEHQQAIAAGDAHVRQAKAFVGAGAFADAAKEYVAAYESDADAEHLFEAGEVARTGKAAESARELYRRYVIAAPSGPHADAARKAIAELTVELTPPVHVEPAHITPIVPIVPIGLVGPFAPFVREDDGPTIAFGISMLSGVKLRADHPLVLAYRAEFVHVGRRVHFGLFTEYGTIEAANACGTDLAGSTPTTPFDFGVRNRFTKCAYVMPGLVIDVHILPRRAIDPWIGIAPGFRFGFDHWTPYVGGMAQPPQSDIFLGVVFGLRAGVDYHPTHAFAGWVVSAIIEAEITVVGDEKPKSSGDHKPASYASVFGGLRSTVAF